MLKPYGGGTPATGLPGILEVRSSQVSHFQIFYLQYSESRTTFQATKPFIGKSDPVALNTSSCVFDESLAYSKSDAGLFRSKTAAHDGRDRLWAGDLETL